jgi:hypothetical protein
MPASTSFAPRRLARTFAFLLAIVCALVVGVNGQAATTCVARAKSCLLGGRRCCSGTVCRRKAFPSGPRACLACLRSGRCERDSDCCPGKNCLRDDDDGIKKCSTVTMS